MRAAKPLTVLDFVCILKQYSILCLFLILT